ncbi:MAG: class I SAM-dependent methyltransferase [Candidatus Latescibacterota bacterium]|nr:MAG: class I SAM-dependent methyltransferase [Candidatus Latescibacterota bacterium]
MTRKADIIFRTIRKILPRNDYVEVSGSIIPPAKRRWCGAEFKNDNFYLKSAEGEANRLIDRFQCTQDSRVLDVGCGQGRLPIGILRVLGEMDYMGVDVDRRSIDWCKHYIERDHPSFKFKHLNLYNERYNKGGVKIKDGFRFEVESKTVDIVYLFSVFSHTTEEDMRVYLKEFLRILADKGNIFFTTFVEEDVPNITINPENYRMKCVGPLHIVRYKKDYLFSILEECGYSIQSFAHGTETDGQSAVYLSKSND